MSQIISIGILYIPQRMYNYSKFCLFQCVSFNWLLVAVNGQYLYKTGRNMKEPAELAV